MADEKRTPDSDAGLVKYGWKARLVTASNGGPGSGADDGGAR